MMDIRDKLLEPGGTLNAGVTAPSYSLPQRAHAAVLWYTVRP